jgi:multidrug efflux pump subunit AcrA (membrane-fusion protein)
MFSCSRQEQGKKYVLHRGEFQASLTETGELQAVVAKHVVMPFLGWKYGYRNKITGMVDHGTEVEEGDTLISLDPSQVMKFLVEQENNLEMEKAALNKLLVEHSNRAKELASQLKQQEASYSMEKLELEKSQFDSESNKKIQDLEFKKAEISLNKTLKSVDYNDKIANYGRQIQEIKVRQLEYEIANANHALTRLVLRSPNKGILQIAYNRSTRQLFKIGDESYPNRSLASIPDLRRMKVKSTVNEVDIGKIKSGQPVIIRLDAFPDLEFHGEINAIGKLSHEKERESNIKVFDIDVLINENNNEILKPGMTVSCEIIYAKLEDVFYIPNNCIIRENDQYFMHLNTRSGIVKTPVELGPRNNAFTVIYGDFKVGQPIVPRESLNQANQPEYANR